MLSIDALDEKAIREQITDPFLDKLTAQVIPGARDALIAVVGSISTVSDHAAESWGNVLRGGVTELQNVGTKWLTDAAKLLDGWTLTLSRPTK